MKKSSEFWNKDYKTGASFRATATEQPSNAVVRFIDFLNSSNLPREGKLLDVGCALGRNSIYLAKQGFQVVGVDVSDVAIRQAEDRANKAGLKVDYRVLDISASWPFDDNSFDLVVDIATSHLLNTQETNSYRDELLRVLKPSGRFLIYTLDRTKDKEAQKLIKEHPGPEENTYVIPQTGVVERTFTLEEIIGLYRPLQVEARELIFHPIEFQGRIYERYFWWVIFKK